MTSHQAASNIEYEQVFHSAGNQIRQPDRLDPSQPGFVPIILVLILAENSVLTFENHIITNLQCSLYSSLLASEAGLTPPIAPEQTVTKRDCASLQKLHASFLLKSTATSRELL